MLFRNKRIREFTGEGGIAEQNLEFRSSRTVPGRLTLFRQGPCLSTFGLLEPKDWRLGGPRCPGRNRATTRRGQTLPPSPRLCHLCSGCGPPTTCVLAISSAFLGVIGAGYVSRRYTTQIRTGPSCPLLGDHFPPSGILKMVIYSRYTRALSWSEERPSHGSFVLCFWGITGEIALGVWSGNLSVT